jgi:hypothetical protein
MSARELVLLSPYRLPTQNALYLSDDDIAAFLNGYSALWHPAAAKGAVSPPRVASPYDHEQPKAQYLYALPETPTPMLPDDWPQRVRDAGAVCFRSGPDRGKTLDNLRSALREAASGEALVDLDTAQLGPFFGVGYGYGQIEALFEAMSHENLLSAEELWREVQQAITALGEADADAPRRQLHSAAERLLAAREVLYPVTIHLLDFLLVEEDKLAAPWPTSFETGLPLNVIACASLLERIAKEHPERLAALRERLAGGLAEVVGGSYIERADAILPVESQLWNLLKGQSVTKELLGQEVRVYGRKRFAFHPRVPLFANTCGMNRVLLLSFDESVLPAHRTAVVNWPSADGKQVEGFTRTPLPADSPQSFFHLAHHLNRTIMNDQAATLAYLHRGKPASPWYDDLLELSRLAPVFGKWNTLPNYFNEVLAGDYLAPASADDFHGDYLNERVQGHGTPADPARQHPISGIAQQARVRRQLDAAWTLTAINRCLQGRNWSEGDKKFVPDLAQLEDQFECRLTGGFDDVAAAQDNAAAKLARRLLAGAKEPTPGYLVLNPCGFRRRVALELADMPALLPLNPPLIACQTDGQSARVVVEVPALGFAWIPKRTNGAVAPHPSRMRLADDRCVRNEIFEAEIDPATGGLRAVRDHRTRSNRLGQQLVFNPGSTTRVKSIKPTSTGPALGEIVSEGELLNTQQEVLATFRQRFRAWVGRPVLDMHIEIRPVKPVEGYAWHAYYGARFAWRDERAHLLRGVNGVSHVTSHPRPVTPDYLELRSGGLGTVILPGGLPFHLRQGTRMLDVILVCEGETERAFDLALALDREYPMQTALGMISPAPVVATTSGPPHVGASGWLFHLDAPNLMLTNLRPAPDGADAVTARLLECGGHDGPAEFRCVRNPVRSSTRDARGNVLSEPYTREDAVQLEVTHNDLVHLFIEFG